MQLEDKIAIQELNYRYALHYDLMQTEEWVAVFTEDGVLDESEFDFGRHEGHAAIRAYGLWSVAEVVHAVHLMANHLITEVSATEATGTVFALVEGKTRQNGHARYHVYYEDLYQKDGGAWRFKSRILHKTFPVEILEPPSSAN